ncbi:MAG: hypothetical protein NC452_17210 [Eubacterium sp.]|nr:hypothetical protein [Eubacterium sp.]
MNEEETSLKIIQLLKAPKGIYAVIKNDSGNYEAFPIILFAVFNDGSFDKIILVDGFFEELDNIVNCVGCYTKKQMKEKFPEGFRIMP